MKHVADASPEPALADAGTPGYREAAPPRSTLRGLWAGRGFRVMFTGQALSALGDWMVTIALMALVLQLSDSSVAVATVLVLRLAPAVIAGPLTARVVSRWDRRRTMLAADAVRAGVVVAIPLLHELWWVYLWAFVLEACGLVFLPARDASIPDLARDEDLPLANGLMLGSSYGTIPLGAAAFGLVSALGGHGHGVPALVFFIDAGSFAVSFLLIRTLHEIAGQGGSSHGAASEPVRFKDALRLPIVKAVGVPTTVVALGLGTLFSVGILFVRKVLDASDAQFSWLVALFGVGAALGLVVLQKSNLRGVGAVRSAVVLQGAVIGGMSLAPGIELTLVGAVLFGAATAMALAASMTVVQETAE